MAFSDKCLDPTPTIDWNHLPCQEHVDQAEDQIRKAMETTPFDPVQTWATSFPCPQCGGALNAFRAVILTVKPEIDLNPPLIQALCACKGHAHTKPDGKVSDGGCGFDCSYPVMKL